MSESVWETNTNTAKELAAVGADQCRAALIYEIGQPWYQEVVREQNTRSEPGVMEDGSGYAL